MQGVIVDTKQQLILNAAWVAFSTYGFRKTSMEDIARGAGMSRPAVYLQYRNKDAIFRSLVQKYYDSTLSDLRLALAGQGPPDEVLKSAFRAQTGEIMRAVLNAPHGHELLDTGAATAGDIKDKGEAELRRVYSEWLAAQAAAGRIRLSGTPDQVAATICAALKGLKDASSDFDTFSAQVNILADLFGAALRVA